MKKVKQELLSADTEEWYSKHTNLSYKGFTTKMEFSQKDNMYYGKIENISDLVTFGCESIDKSKRIFKKVVNDYLKLKKELKKKGYDEVLELHEKIKTI